VINGSGRHAGSVFGSAPGAAQGAIESVSPEAIRNGRVIFDMGRSGVSRRSAAGIKENTKRKIQSGYM
jgi:hypothetical protein